MDSFNFDVFKLKNILDLEEDDYINIQKYKDQCIPLVENIVEQFYAIVSDDPELMNFFVYKTNLERAMKWQKAYFIELLQGIVNDDYTQKRIHSGWLHAEIGLPVSFYIAFYRFFTVNIFEKAVTVAEIPIDENFHSYIISLVKLILFDLSISIEVHEKTLLDHQKK